MRKFIVDFEGEEEYEEPEPSLPPLPRYLITWSGPDRAIDLAKALYRQGMEAWVGKLKYIEYRKPYDIEYRKPDVTERILWFSGTNDHRETEHFYYLDTTEKMWRAGTSSRKGSIEIVEVYELKRVY